MLIKSIKIENFRQYRGKQEMDFAIDPDKNVTVVKGENGAGKTTLLESFTWCLYGDINLPNKDKLLNTEVGNKLEANDIATVSVEINFSHNHQDYFVKRLETFIKDNSNEVNRLGRDFTIKKKNKSGVMQEIKKEEVNNILPSDLSTYFFFDGERIENLSKSNTKGKKDLSNAVRNILGLDVILNAKKHLQKLEGQLEQEYNDDNSNVINNAKQELKEKREASEVYKQRLETVNEEINIIEENIEIIEEKIKANASASQLQKNRELLQKELDNRKSMIESLLKDIEKLNKNTLPEYLASKLLKLSGNKVDLSMIQTKGIAGIDGTAIDYIIEREECICGQKITKGSDFYNNLINQKEYQPPASLGTIIAQFNEKTSDINNKATEYIADFEQKYLSIETCKEIIEQLESDINDISMELRFSEDVGKLEKERKELLDEKKKIEENKIAIQVNLKDAEQKITELETSLDKLSLNDEHNRLINYRKEYVRELEKQITRYYRSKEQKIKDALNSNVSKIFDSLIHSKHKIQINDDYTFRVIDIDGEDATSQGQDVITSFAFIGGLIDLAKTNHKDIEVTEPYPLIMDAPFAKLSKVHRRNVASILPKITEQFILFTVDSQYEGDIEDTLRTRVGKEFELVMYNDNEKYTMIK